MKCDVLILSQLSWDVGAFLLVFHNWQPETFFAFPSVYFTKQADQSMKINIYFYLFIYL